MWTIEIVVEVQVVRAGALLNHTVIARGPHVERTKGRKNRLLATTVKIIIITIRSMS